jgi:hypothetical protein
MYDKPEVLQLPYYFFVFCRCFVTWKVVKIKIGGYRLQIGGDVGPRRLKFTKNTELYMVGS